MTIQERLRAERQSQKLREDAERRSAIRHKTLARSSKLAVKSKTRSQSRRKNGIDSSDAPSDATARRSSLGRDNDDVHVIASIAAQALPSSDLVAASAQAIDSPLEHKRSLAIQERERRHFEHARAVAAAAQELDRRRAENIAMRAADELASALERHARKTQRRKELRLRLARLARVPMFAGVQQLSGKTLRVAVFEHRARGYDPDGIRVVAYDPMTSTTYTLTLSTREYRTLGYGRSLDGVRAFCKWLCLLYEKRTRRFRLVWSGPPCPPPLRVREYDSAICVHKEGVRLATESGERGAFVVAAYVRPDAHTKVMHFVVSDLRRGGDASCLERVVTAAELVSAIALTLQHCDGGSDDSVVVWKHGLAARADAVDVHATSQHETRVYSGEVRLRRDGALALVHVFDASPTEYVVEVHAVNAPSSESPATHDTTEATPTRFALRKCDVNPYGVHLPASAFSDLIASIDIRAHAVAATNACVSAAVASSWLDKLAKYMRVLRLGKVGYRIGRAFYVATLSLVQQKTEFRASLLLELTRVSSRDSTLGAKQSLRISLSEYVRCSHGARHVLPIALATTCDVCDASINTEMPNDTVAERQRDSSASSPSSAACASCVAIQSARLAAIHTLVLTNAAQTQAPVIDYHGHCCICGALATPIVVVLHWYTTAAAAGVLQLLGYSFSCIDMSVMSGSGDHIDARLSALDELRQAIDLERIVVLYNADCGTTAAAANDFVYELHAQLFPYEDAHDGLRFHTVVVADARASAASPRHVGSTAHERRWRDQDIAEALDALASTAAHIATQEPIYPTDSSSDSDATGDTTAIDIAPDDPRSFEAYLVTEALLVEATRVLLEPERSWRRPGETVGASSWSTACAFLADPVALSEQLQRVQSPLALPHHAQETLSAYFSHAKWPRTYDDVRPVFHHLLCFMLHVAHVFELVEHRGGVLSNPTSSGSTSALSVLSLSE